MTYDANALKMIEELSMAKGAPAFEDEVLLTARKYAENVGRVEEDKLRNLYIYRKENTGKKPVLMLDAHSDEVGFMVRAIYDDGSLAVLPIGGWRPEGLPSADMLVRNRDGRYIPAIFATIPSHFHDHTPQDILKMRLDVGATSRREAEEDFGIRIGEPVVPASAFRFDSEHGLLFGKAFDCRIGVAALLETLKRLEGEELPCDIVGVLSSQEELGERGCMVSARHAAPDVALVFEGCPADDVYRDGVAVQAALHKGGMLRHMDKGVICSPRLQRFALDLCAKNGVRVQEAVRDGGGNDGAKINAALDGTPVIVVAVPVRYPHSCNGICAYDDFEETVRFAVTVIRSLTPDVIDAF